MQDKIYLFTTSYLVCKVFEKYFQDIPPVQPLPYQQDFPRSCKIEKF